MTNVCSQFGVRWAPLAHHGPDRAEALAGAVEQDQRVPERGLHASEPIPARGARRYPGRVASPSLIEFPADDPERARRFWEGLLGQGLAARGPGEGEGWQSRGGEVAVGVHVRGPGPGDRVSLPYFAVDDLPGAIERVVALGGAVIHPGERWAICRDSEGSPFGLGGT